MTIAPRYKVLAISGSLRAASLNSLFLTIMGQLKPDNYEFRVQQGLDKLPFFNPDHNDSPSIEILDWRQNLRDADLVIIASPEYAHGVTAVLKNALDWVVSSGELTDKPLAVPNLSPRATRAQAQLIEIVEVMGAHYSEACSPRSSVSEPYILPNATIEQLYQLPGYLNRLKGLWSAINHQLVVGST